ncbi:MAG: hypothetical protein Terrestrivirus2_234 [Terrestrivirus sp.]|jgi:hypothetical protein|uniref:Uncharacterized protein n=1 Tax=Terrestrivirus sp. TaxID=2487775 RepID=A0A3G4ZLL2_9VIRU|nr:MAG: hypothetical protein Terrestrivirus2_234 [Terrestrivirus sp.]
MFYNYLKSIYKSVKNYDPIYKSHDSDNLNKLNYYSKSHSEDNFELSEIIRTNNKILNGLARYQIINDIDNINYLAGGVINSEFEQAKNTADKSLHDLITKINDLELEKITKALNFIVNYINTLDKNVTSTDLSSLRAQLDELNEMLKIYTDK